MKILLAIPTNRGVKPKTVESLLALSHPTVPLVASEGYTIAENRNYCVYQAQKQGCTHILFVDDDMTFPASTLDMLLAHGKEIVGVDSKSRTFPLQTTVSLLKNGELWPPKEVPPHYKMPEKLFEVYGIGFGVALIDMKVFQEIKAPWFDFKTNETGQVAIGEDQWFCNKAREAGYKIYCDPTIPIGHIGDWEFSEINNPVSDEKIIIDNSVLEYVS